MGGGAYFATHHLPALCVFSCLCSCHVERLWKNSLYEAKTLHIKAQVTFQLYSFPSMCCATDHTALFNFAVSFLIYSCVRHAHCFV